VYQEESDWFEYLKAFASAAAQAHATARYREDTVAMSMAARL
jgi:hypothetical protein